MARFLIRRLLFAAVLLVCTSSAALLLTRLAPGDLTAQLGPNASRSEIATTRARFDLDRNPIAQWALWASRAVRLDFGNSFLYNRPVGPLKVVEEIPLAFRVNGDVIEHSDWPRPRRIVFP